MESQKNILPIVELRSEELVKRIIHEAETTMIRLVSDQRSPFDVCWVLLALQESEEYRVRSVTQTLISYLYDWCLKRDYEAKRDIVAHIMGPLVLKNFGKKMPSEHMEFVSSLIKEYFEYPTYRIYTESFEYLYSIVFSLEKISSEIAEKIVSEVEVATDNNWFSDIWRCAFGLACLVELEKTEELFQKNTRWLLSNVALGKLSEEELIVVSWLLNTHLREIQFDKELQQEIEDLSKKTTRNLISLSERLKDSLSATWSEIRRAEEAPKIQFTPSYHIGPIELSLLVKTFRSLLPDLLICYSSEEHEKIKKEIGQKIIGKQKRKTGGLIFLTVFLFFGFMYLFSASYSNFVQSTIPKAYMDPSLVLYYFVWFFTPPPLILIGIEELLGRAIFPKKIWEIAMKIGLGIVGFIIQLYIIGGIK